MIYASVQNVAARYDLHVATIWRMAKEGSFPKPVKLSPGCTRWRVADLEAWEQSRVTA